MGVGAWGRVGALSAMVGLTGCVEVLALDDPPVEIEGRSAGTLLLITDLQTQGPLAQVLDSERPLPVAFVAPKDEIRQLTILLYSEDLGLDESDLEAGSEDVCATAEGGELVELATMLPSPDEAYVLDMAAEESTWRAVDSPSLGGIGWRQRRKIANPCVTWDRGETLVFGEDPVDNCQPRLTTAADGPDGSVLAGACDGKVHRIGDEAVTELPVSSTSTAASLAFAHDGSERLFIVRAGGWVESGPAAGGTFLPLPALPSGRAERYASLALTRTAAAPVLFLASDDGYFERYEGGVWTELAKVPPCETRTCDNARKGSCDFDCRPQVRATGPDEAWVAFPYAEVLWRYESGQVIDAQPFDAPGYEGVSALHLGSDGNALATTEGRLLLQGSDRAWRSRGEPIRQHVFALGDSPSGLLMGGVRGLVTQNPDEAVTCGTTKLLLDSFSFRIFHLAIREGGFRAVGRSPLAGAAIEMRRGDRPGVACEP